MLIFFKEKIKNTKQNVKNYLLNSVRHSKGFKDLAEKWCFVKNIFEHLHLTSF